MTCVTEGTTGVAVKCVTEGTTGVAVTCMTEDTTGVAVTCVTEGTTGGGCDVCVHVASRPALFSCVRVLQV